MSRHPPGPPAMCLRTSWRFKSSHPHSQIAPNAARSWSSVRCTRSRPRLHRVAVWVRTVDRRSEKVKSEDNDSSTMKAIINGEGWPYEQGWVEVDARQQQFIAIAHVVSVEARERTGGDSE